MTRTKPASSTPTSPFRLLVVLVLLGSLCGCAVTKIATVPMRVGGAVVSAVPVVGGAAGTAIDTTADVID